MKKLYLAGGIWGVKDPYTWRQMITDNLPPDWQAVDPLKLTGGVFKEGDDPRHVVATDLDAIEDSDAVLARVDQASWGTGMEIFHAHGMAVPVIGLRLDKHRNLPPGPWLRVHTVVILDNPYQAIDYIKNEGWKNAPR